MHLVKQVIKVARKGWGPQGGPFSPLAANIYLNEIDWTFDAIRRKTAQEPYEAVNYHRFADDIASPSAVITRNRVGAARLQRPRGTAHPAGVALNREKTKS